MHTSVLLSHDGNRAIMLRSKHQRNSSRSKALQLVKRSEAQFGTKSYRDALQRAFNKAKEQIYFNPDMTNFITLTYAKADNTIDEVLHDVKMLIKTESRRSRDSGTRLPPKYIFIMEYQERGSIHVHMIANQSFTLQVNDNGYNELVYWQKGFSSVLQIKDFDHNFRPYLYLFKYMKKSQRIGKSFVHSSRNLTNYRKLTTEAIFIPQWNTINQEYTETQVETTTFKYYKNYLQKHDILAT